MRIVWDEPKRIANLAKHGLDFAALDVAFFEGAIVTPARSSRLVAIGRLTSSEAVTVIFAPLGGEGLSIVSMRRANKTERDRLDGP